MSVFFLQSLRYRVFCDLWRKGYHLTNGLKYGGDYLVYPGITKHPNGLKYGGDYLVYPGITKHPAYTMVTALQVHLQQHGVTICDHQI